MHIIDALPLPPRPDVSQYRKLAKDLLAAVKSGDPDAVLRWSRSWLSNLFRLTDRADSRRIGQPGDGDERRADDDTPIADAGAPGVTIPLLEMMLEAGANVNSRDGVADAGGLGNLEVVRHFVCEDGALRHGATQAQLDEALNGACAYGHLDVVRLLVERGVDPARILENGSTVLHSAAYWGYLEIIDLLLARGVPVDVRDSEHRGTPIEWALYAWATRDLEDGRASVYYEVIRKLARAGAKPEAVWLEHNEPRRILAKKIEADARMQAALRGEVG